MSNSNPSLNIVSNGSNLKITSQTITANSSGISMINPPIIGQVYFDKSMGQSMIYTSTGWIQVNSSPINNTQPTVTFKTTDGRSVTTDQIVDFMELMKRRMLVLTPDFEKHAKFPALQEAYDQYLVLDRLMNDKHNPDT